MKLGLLHYIPALLYRRPLGPAYGLRASQSPLNIQYPSPGALVNESTFIPRMSLAYLWPYVKCPEVARWLAAHLAEKRQVYAGVFQGQRPRKAWRQGELHLLNVYPPT